MFDDFIKFLIPRGSSSALVEANRGVRLLSSEPARAGNEMLFIYILLRKVYINRFKFITDILFLLFIGIILQSFIILALTICFIFFNLNIKSFLYLSIVSLFLINLDLILWKSF